MERGRFHLPGSCVAGAVVVLADSRLRFGRHFHDEFGIGVIERGAQGSPRGRGPVEAGRGDVITVNPGEVHDGAPIGEAGRAWRMVYLAPDLMDRLLAGERGHGAARFEFAAPVMRHPDLTRRVRRLIEAASRPAEATLGASAEELLVALVGELAASPDGCGDPGDDGRRRTVPAGIARARARIDAAPAAAASLDTLAQESGLDRFQLIRGFVRATGLTPHAYLVQRRLVLARRLIAGGALLAEAAVASGFADQSHMTRAFVRSLGLTPGAYAAAVG